MWVAVALTVACTKASKEPKKDKPETKRQPPPPRLSKALRVDVNAFSPDPADHAGVMIRFDRIRRSALGRATEKLLSVLPDHHRVVGYTGRRVTDAFDLVLITSSNPSLQTATNMSARMAIPPGKMRALLDNKVFATRWLPVLGGALGKANVPGWDPRVYLIPMIDWIVLVKPNSLGWLSAERKGDYDLFQPPAKLPAWLRNVPQLAGIGPRRLVALGALDKLPKTISPPMVGSIDMPQHLRAALERGKHVDVLSGELVFATPAKAAAFEKAASAGRSILRAYKPQAGGPHIPAIAALRKLRLYQSGKHLQFSMAMTRAQTVELTRYAIGLVTNMMAPPVPPTPPPQPPPTP